MAGTFVEFLLCTRHWAKSFYIYYLMCVQKHINNCIAHHTKTKYTHLVDYKILRMTVLLRCNDIHRSMNGIEIAYLGIYMDYLIAFVQKKLTRHSPYTASGTTH